MNKKRQMWVQVCGLWAVLWTFAALVFALPLLAVAALSILMILLPVGISSNEPAEKREPNEWRTDVKRPWR